MLAVDQYDSKSQLESVFVFNVPLTAMVIWRRAMAQSKKDSKDQETIQLTQDTTWESNKNTINITNKSQEVSLIRQTGAARDQNHTTPAGLQGGFSVSIGYVFSRLSQSESTLYLKTLLGKYLFPLNIRKYIQHVALTLNK